MNELLDDDHPTSRSDREVTLSTGAILSIFLGLVLLCGACFGVGYNVGHKSAPTPLTLNDANSADSPAGTEAETAKPSPSSVAETSAPAPVTVATPAPRPAPVVRKPAPVVTTPEHTDVDASDEAPTPHTATNAAGPAPVVRVPPSALMPSVAPAAGASTVMVQVAAVSHQEDADLLVGALRARGYTVSARQSGVDHFIHVQVGPFADKKQAEAMRQRLIADGYNAIVK